MTEEYINYHQWFSNDIKDIKNVKCWIYGHTHTSSINIINNIPFICNPTGYKNENKIINIDYNKYINL
jgi:UDP-2,3-diacylglucosamine pyrophosphatase LpxH